jgi:hypothetical protein
MDIVEQLLNECLAILNEKAKTKMIKLTKKSQIRRAGGRAAIQIAKEKKDPVYKKYEYHRQKYLELKKKIMKKNSRKGLARAKKSLN